MAELFHPPGTLIVGLAGFLLFAALAVMSNVFSNEATTWWTTAATTEYARVLLARSPGEAVEPHTLQILQSTADGHRPSVWA